MPPEHGAHTGDQLARIERLAEIVVGADLETDDAVHVLFQRGEQDDRHVRPLRPQVPAHIEARAIRQHHVENDQVDLMGRELIAQLPAVRGKQHAEALALDVAGQELANFRIVVDDENAWRGRVHVIEIMDSVRASEAPPSSLAQPHQRGQFCNENRPFQPTAMFRHKSRSRGNIGTRQDQNGQRTQPRTRRTPTLEDVRL